MEGARSIPNACPLALIRGINESINPIIGPKKPLRHRRRVTALSGPHLRPVRHPSCLSTNLVLVPSLPFLLKRKYWPPSHLVSSIQYGDHPLTAADTASGDQGSCAGLIDASSSGPNKSPEEKEANKSTPEMNKRQRRECQTRLRASRHSGPVNYHNGSRSARRATRPHTPRWMRPSSPFFG